MEPKNTEENPEWSADAAEEEEGAGDGAEERVGVGRGDGVDTGVRMIDEWECQCELKSQCRVW
jgi:hypothetical protein